MSSLHSNSGYIRCRQEQWCNRGQGAGGRVPPRHFLRRNFYWPTGKKEEGEKWKMERKRRKIGNGRGGKLKMEGERYENENEKRTCFFFSFAFHFLKPLKFGVYKNGQFYQEKSYFTPRKNQENWLCPLWKIFLLRPWTGDTIHQCHIFISMCSNWAFTFLMKHTQNWTS